MRTLQEKRTPGTGTAVCLGSLNLDFVYEVSHFVSAGETLRAESRAEHCGGKGLNQSIALSRAGAAVVHGGAVGPEGGVLTALLRQSGVDTTGIRKCESPTGHALIQVTPEGENCILIFGGANRAVTEQDVDRLLEPYGAGDLFLTQNEISANTYAITRAKARAMTVAFNASPISEELTGCPALCDVDLFIINEVEGAALTGETEPGAICHKMKEKYPKSEILLTLGGDGSVYYNGQDEIRQSAFPAEVVDTTAAGDTYTGFYLAGRMAGKSAAESMKLASCAAALAVSRKGAAPSIPTLDEVLRTLKQSDESEPGA